MLGNRCSGVVSPSGRISTVTKCPVLFVSAVSTATLFYDVIWIFAMTVFIRVCSAGYSGFSSIMTRGGKKLSDTVKPGHWIQAVWFFFLHSCQSVHTGFTRTQRWFLSVFSCVRIEGCFAPRGLTSQACVSSLRHISWWCQQTYWLAEEELCSCICSVQPLCPLPSWVWTSWSSGRSIQGPDKGRPRCWK